jgi:hypothetical protein
MSFSIGDWVVTNTAGALPLGADAGGKYRIVGIIFTGRFIGDIYLDTNPYGRFMWTGSKDELGDLKQSGKYDPKFDFNQKMIWLVGQRYLSPAPAPSSQTTTITLSASPPATIRGTGGNIKIYPGTPTIKQEEEKKEIESKKEKKDDLTEFFFPDIKKKKYEPPDGSPFNFI